MVMAHLIFCSKGKQFFSRFAAVRVGGAVGGSGARFLGKMTVAYALTALAEASNQRAVQMEMRGGSMAAVRKKADDILHGWGWTVQCRNTTG